MQQKQPALLQAASFLALSSGLASMFLSDLYMMGSKINKEENEE